MALDTGIEYPYIEDIINGTDRPTGSGRTQMQIIIRDGQVSWAADWDTLRVAMIAAGWDVYGRGYNARAVEPEDDSEAYTRLCEQVPSIGGEGSEQDLPNTEAEMTYAPSEGPRTWILWGVGDQDDSC